MPSCRAARMPIRRGASTGIWGSSIRSFQRLPGGPVQVQFTPHLLPMNRGILATVYVKGEPEGGACSTLASAYVA